MGHGYSLLPAPDRRVPAGRDLPHRNGKPGKRTARDYRDDPQYIKAQEILADPGTDDPSAAMMRRFGAATAMRAIQQWVSQPDAPEMNEYQRERLDMMMALPYSVGGDS